MTTIRDVANRAGVSTATVSRALSGNGYVGTQTRELVEAAAAELNYIPNALARGLKTRRSGLIGLVIPEIADPFFSLLAQGVEQAASERGFQVLLGASLGDAEREAKYLNLLLAHEVDGAIVCPAREAELAWEVMQRHRIPTVFVDDYPLNGRVDAVHSDNVGGMRALVEHLIGLGHRGIGMVGGRRSSVPGRQRAEGYLAALTGAGIEADGALLLDGPWTIEDGSRMAGNMLELASPPTAFVAGSSLLAAGVMRAVRGGGLRVPEDVALASFDEPLLTSDLDPFLTAALQPIEEMSRTAARLLMARMDGTAIHAPRVQVLPVELAVRQSSGGYRVVR
ncbi:MAG: LacI family DNA-binding transcriptional regulator [Thermomicrobiales bacterium]